VSTLAGPAPVAPTRQDVSRLLDLCRQSIAFDDLAGVAACLRAVARDPDVCLVRVGGRMDAGFDAAASAGYRDLALNLRLATPATERLGVDGHVCEVQLILRQIAELKVGMQ
jgi:hypothetical protein